METLENYLVFILTKNYFKPFTRTNEIYSWKSKGISEESIENITTSDNTFSPRLTDSRPLPVVKSNRNCLLRNNISAFKKVINLYISHTLNIWLRDLNEVFILGKCLF